MKNKILGLLGYLFLIFSINLEIFETNEQLINNFIEFIGYSFILYNLYNDKKGKETNKKENNIEIGHLILFVYYFYYLFLSDNNFDIVNLLTLFAHFILIKNYNNKMIKIGYILSFIYYLIKIPNYLNNTNYILTIKLFAYSLLALYYINKSVLKIF
jgi:hypothetical protein